MLSSGFIPTLLHYIAHGQTTDPPEMASSARYATAAHLQLPAPVSQQQGQAVGREEECRELESREKLRPERRQE